MMAAMRSGRIVTVVENQRLGDSCYGAFERGSGRNRPQEELHRSPSSLHTLCSLAVVRLVDITKRRYWTESTVRTTSNARILAHSHPLVPPKIFLDSEAAVLISW